ncbi:MAG: hypothetical protein BM557_02265 [Flavobacterium sp. MedPE-SWcel]|uniref:hypothetical protein n=1 Tax=uncultured Flavobacterium sp. TaxID=165435 RepID=UPI00091AAA91|nr:hypothetical protein [uncultured Flavobacterium sp.]OIQ21643.1 MAG: hypothetical protein BM557_02265 [Flavobacterium sp. MedPE-SWcel]
MKKLFLFLTVSILTLSISSCSDDDSNATPNNSTYIATGSVTINIDGNLLTYNNIIITSNGASDINITASQDGSSSEFLTFSTTLGNVGAGVINNLQIVSADYEQIVGYTSNTQINGNNTLQSLFTAELITPGGGFDNPVTGQGTINIAYTVQ